MSPHTHVTSTSTSATPVPVKVWAAFADLDRQYVTASARMPMTTDTEQAARAACLALISARRAGWWRVLKRWTDRDPGLHPVYGEAVIAALYAERGNARFWRQSAADWAARANGDRHGSGLWATWDHLDGGAVA